MASDPLALQPGCSCSHYWQWLKDGWNYLIGEWTPTEFGRPRPQIQAPEETQIQAPEQIQIQTQTQIQPQNLAVQGPAQPPPPQVAGPAAVARVEKPQKKTRRPYRRHGRYEPWLAALWDNYAQLARRARQRRQKPRIKRPAKAQPANQRPRRAQRENAPGSQRPGKAQPANQRPGKAQKLFTVPAVAAQAEKPKRKPRGLNRRDRWIRIYLDDIDCEFDYPELAQPGNQQRPGKAQKTKRDTGKGRLYTVPAQNSAHIPPEPSTSTSRYPGVSILPSWRHPAERSGTSLSARTTGMPADGENSAPLQVYLPD